MNALYQMPRELHTTNPRPFLHSALLDRPKGKNVQFETEVKVLQFLRGKTTLQIPNPEFLGTHERYMGYKKIPGGDLTRELYEHMDGKHLQILYNDLAVFMAQLHAISLAQVSALGVKKWDYVAYIHLVETAILPRRIDPHVYDFVQETVNEFKKLVMASGAAVFLHGDIHTDNMAFDEAGSKLNGIFDFSDMFIGEVAQEFAQLYKFDKKCLEVVLQEYEAVTGRRVNPRHALIYGRFYEMCDLAEYIDQPQSELHQRALSRISMWMKEKDDYRTET